MTKKRLEAIVAGDSSVASSTLPLKAGIRSTNPQGASKSKPQPKQKAGSDRPLKALEALHERMGVKENLQLGGATRIKLNSDLALGPSRKRKPAPDFDLRFTELSNQRPSKIPRVEDDGSDVSGGDLPDALELIDVTGNLESRRQGATSESTDYADPEFDALIADFPIPGNDSQDGSPHEERPGSSITAQGSAPGTSFRHPKERRWSVSSSDSLPKNHSKECADAPIEVRAPLLYSGARGFIQDNADPFVAIEGTSVPSGYVRRGYPGEGCSSYVLPRQSVTSHFACTCANG